MIRQLLPRIVIATAFVGCLCLALPGVGLTRNQPPGESLPAPAGAGEADRAAKYMGVASCASMACHNRNGPKGAPFSEYTTWAGHDPHTRAYRVLYDERSLEMVRNLATDGPALHPTKTPLCLECHAMAASEEDQGPRFSLIDGVGCESCHGPAENYLEKHYQAGFRGKSAAEKEKGYGLWNTKNLPNRIRICSSCHLGDATREVNHDLIAAGHPRLSFEFSSYHAIYPQHWLREDDLRRYPDFEARAWILGQLTTAQESLALLEHRAKVAASGGDAPWPEFAEYACYACHKDLQVNSPRQRGGFGDRVPGSFPWGTWYITMLKGYAEEIGRGEELVPALEELRKLMEAPSPDPRKVASQAAVTVKLLDAWVKEAEKSPRLSAGAVQDLMKKFAGRGAARVNEQTWDETAQLYLAVAAMHKGLQEMGGRPGPAVRKDLLTIKARLKGAFPPDFNSPKKYDPLAAPPLKDLFTNIRIGLAP